MISVHRITRTAPAEGRNVITAQGRGHGGAPDDSIEIVETPGLRARPPVRASSEALVLELPNGDRFAFLVDKGARTGAVACEDGETQLHGAANAATVIRLRASGDIEITPATGRNVILAGGTAKVAREGDAVAAASSMASWISAVSTALTLTPPAGFGAVAAGADHVKA